MRKKNVDYEKIAALEFKVDELKNKIILNYINSLSKNEMKALQEISVCTEKLKKERKDYKKEKQERRELETSFNIFISFITFCSGLFTLFISPIVSILAMLATCFMTRYIKKDSLKKIDKTLLEQANYIRKIEKKLNDNKRIVDDTKKRIDIITSESNVKIFEKLECELLKSNMKLDNIYIKLEQIISDFEKNIDSQKKVESGRLKPVEVASIDLLYKNSYDKAKSKTLKLKK